MSSLLSPTFQQGSFLMNDKSGDPGWDSEIKSMSQSRGRAGALQRDEVQSTTKLIPGKGELKDMFDSAIMSTLAAAYSNVPLQIQLSNDQLATICEQMRNDGFEEEGKSIDELMPGLMEAYTTNGRNHIHSGFISFVPGGGLPHSVIADTISGLMNRYTGYAQDAPAMVQLECNVIRWLCDMMGYPKTSFGMLLSGGSLANWSAMHIARAALLPEDFLWGVLYCSDQIHHSNLKAAKMCGFPRRNVRTVPSREEDFGMDIGALKKMIKEDRARGLTPFMIIACYGATNTGAVDNLPSLAKIAAKERMWFHVDAAYGGFFMLTHQGKRLGKGIELADSITIDPHKGMFLPCGTGGLLVKDKNVLKNAYRTDEEANCIPSYLRMRQSSVVTQPGQSGPGAHPSAAKFAMPASDTGAAPSDPIHSAKTAGSCTYQPPPPSWARDLVDFAEVTCEQSRPFRGLRIWLPLKMLGVGGFRKALEERLYWARYLALKLVEMSEQPIMLRKDKNSEPTEWRIELFCKPLLTVVNFCLRKLNKPLTSMVDESQLLAEQRKEAKEKAQAANATSTDNKDAPATTDSQGKATTSDVKTEGSGSTAANASTATTSAETKEKSASDSSATPSKDDKKPGTTTTTADDDKDDDTPNSKAKSGGKKRLHYLPADEDENAMTSKLMMAINAKGRVMVYAAAVRSHFTIRAIAFSCRSQKLDFDNLLEDLQTGIKELKAQYA